MKSPDQIFGQLFHDLHVSEFWPDGKMISDAVPKFSVDKILNQYEELKNQQDFNLRLFFEEYFTYAETPTSDFASDTSMRTQDHIDKLWNVLTRDSDKDILGSSLISLPNKYVVPGGRFNEIYYWDSYFTMLGLVVSNKVDIVENMIDNFSWQIKNIGFIPNGNRTYFLGRSQPPFFALMVDLLANVKGDSVYLKYRASLVKEYSFWMHSNESLISDNNSGHLVTLENGLLNRYFDKFSSPRPEMYGDDIKLKSKVNIDSEVLFGHIRSACESGWDFSSRWLNESLKLESIHTLDILPVDLNCLLFHLETVIAKSYELFPDENKNHKQESRNYYALSKQRSEMIQNYFWDESNNFYFDFNYKQNTLCKVESLASVFPLFFNIATKDQALKVAEKLEEKFLKAGGLITTTLNSGQQWDAPNGWAPLQYMTVKGLENYGFKELANDIKSRWLKLNDKVFSETGKMLEKYNVENIDLLSGGGEYPVQDGFGWTNGVYLAFSGDQD